MQIISKFYGKYYEIEYLREKVGVSREGTTVLALGIGAEEIGFKTLAVKTTFENISKLPQPFIVFFKPNHYVVVYKTSKNHIYTSDPNFGLLRYTNKEFKDRWLDNDGQGSVLLLETTDEFYSQKESEVKEKMGLKYILKYFFLYKQLFSQLLVGLIVTSVLSVLFPFLTQALVDIGINQKSLDFVYLVLIGQLILFASQNAIGFIRSWIFLHISTKINISLISDFLFKIMKLPIMFIDSRSIGDIYQRIMDLNRLQVFISSNTLNFLYSIFTLIIFSFILIFYNSTLFLIFLFGSLFGIVWILLFLSKRKELDYKRFFESTSSQNVMVQMLTGMIEIKLSGAEKQKRKEWEKVQTKIFNINIKSLYWSQIQQFGSVFINQLKNIIITIIAASQVINGEITLGMMMAIMYILGQITSPLEQIISLIQLIQEAKISMARVSEVYDNEVEEIPGFDYLNVLPQDKSIVFRDVSFQYFKNDSNYILRNLNFVIPEKKVTAIVGASGSGKTTIIKLLLKFYNLREGSILIGGRNIEDYSHSYWRRNCGIVMQDGYFFADTIASNIALGNNDIDIKMLEYAIDIANLNEFIESLPQGYSTKLGMMGDGISQGQKQRILIARAVYKNPEYIFLDEATSDLDSENEFHIISKLNKFFKDKTTLIVAHRLSTIKNADNIIVLKNGEIAEQGRHEELIGLKGAYYKLFNSQF